MRRAVAVAAFALVATACGGPPGTIDADAAADLVARVEAVRDAAEQGDRGDALAELDALRRTLETHRTQGRVDDERARHIIGATDAVEALLPGPEDAAAEPPPAPIDDAAPEEVDDAEHDEAEHDEAEHDEADDDRGPPHGDPPGRGRGRGQGRGNR